MKFITTILAGIIVGGFGVYFTLDWQEENLEFSISDPAKFGEITYQNITLINNGWNPAVNIKVHINHPEISFPNLQSTAVIKKIDNVKNGIASIDRIRRDESLVLSLAYEGAPLSENQVKIASDRSIAKFVENEVQYNIPLWIQVIVGFFAFTFVVGVVSSIVIPQFVAFKKKAEERAKEREKA